MIYHIPTKKCFGTPERLPFEVSRYKGPIVSNASGDFKEPEVERFEYRDIGEFMKDCIYVGHVLTEKEVNLLLNGMLDLQMNPRDRYMLDKMYEILNIHETANVAITEAYEENLAVCEMLRKEARSATKENDRLKRRHYEHLEKLREWDSMNLWQWIKFKLKGGLLYWD